MLCGLLVGVYRDARPENGGSAIRAAQLVARSQAQETFLNDGQKRPTLIYNGYGEQVAGLYKGLDKEPLFM